MANSLETGETSIAVLSFKINVKCHIYQGTRRAAQPIVCWSWEWISDFRQHYNWCYNLSMVGLKLIYLNKRYPRCVGTCKSLRAGAPKCIQNWCLGQRIVFVFTRVLFWFIIPKMQPNVEKYEYDHLIHMTFLKWYSNLLDWRWVLHNHQTSSIRGTKAKSLIVSRLVLQWFLPNSIEARC